jgi:hypothetical protein
MAETNATSSDLAAARESGSLTPPFQRFSIPSGNAAMNPFFRASSVMPISCCMFVPVLPAPWKTKTSGIAALGSLFSGITRR